MIPVLALLAALALVGCRTESPVADPDPPPLTTVGLVVDHDAGSGWVPLDSTSRDPVPLGPTTLTLHDGRILTVPGDVMAHGWCWELGGRPDFAAARQCYMGFALAADGRTVEAAALLNGRRGRSDSPVPLADQDRFLAETLTVEGVWRNVSGGTAYLREPLRTALTLDDDPRISCVGEDTPQELRGGAFVSVTVDQATARLTSVSCVYSD